jgi:hypothetical protein
VPITTRGLIDGRVILRRGEGTFLRGNSSNTGGRRSGGFITTCLERREWRTLFSLGESARPIRGHDGIGRRHRCTRCCGIKLRDGELVLFGELLEATPEGNHHGICQLGGNTPPIAAMTSSEVAKPAPFNASLAVAEAVLLGDMGVGLIN